MPHPNPNLDQTGRPQSYPTRIAANLNWAKRMCMGFISQAHIHQNHLWITRHPEYHTALTVERRGQLEQIMRMFNEATAANQAVIDAIEQYYTMPAMPQPKRITQKEKRKLS